MIAFALQIPAFPLMFFIVAFVALLLFSIFYFHYCFVFSQQLLKRFFPFMYQGSPFVVFSATLLIMAILTLGLVVLLLFLAKLVLFFF